MPPVNVISGAIVALGFVVILRAFMPLITKEIDNFGRYLMRGAIGVAAVMVMRLGWWDITQFVAGAHWPEIIEYVGGQRISAVFNLLMFWPIRDFLIARWYLIPEADRRHWRWWNAAFHPHKRCLASRLTRKADDNG